MDLNTRYGLEFNPFIKNSADIIVSFKEYNEAVARLNYILSVKGFGLLTGRKINCCQNMVQRS